MMAQWLYRLSGRLPLRVINDDAGHPYLERYYLIDALGVTVYVHRFVADDPDRGLHDHPWRWAATLVLAGPGYDEETRYGTYRRKWFGFFGGQHFHRVRLINYTPTWTLFIHSRARAKPWGFWRRKSVLHHPDGSSKESAGWIQHGPSSTVEWWRNAPHGSWHPDRLPM